MGKRGPQPLDRWSRDFERCTRCGTTERPHKARGLCVNCWMHDRPHRDANARANRRYRAREATRRPRLGETRLGPLPYHAPTVFPLGIKFLWKVAAGGSLARCACGGQFLLDGDGDYRCLMCGRVDRGEH